MIEKNIEEFILKIEEKTPTMEKELEGSKWYLVSTQSNCESKARKNIASQAVLGRVADRIEQIVFPAYEEEVSVKGGGKRKRKVRIYPNYLFIQCDMNEEVYQAIKQADKVSGFVQAGRGIMHGLPRPVRDLEVSGVINKIKQFVDGEVSSSKFSVGDFVRIKSGPFKDHVGYIDVISETKIKVNVTIFGRETPIDLNQKDIEIEKN